LLCLLVGVAAAAEPEEVSFRSGNYELRGFLYRPEGSGPFRAILYNHGSEDKPGWKPELGQYFTRHGYVFFVPHRRSHGRSPRDPAIDALYRSGASGVVALHEAHLQDQWAAFDFLRRLTQVDPNRIAIAGCSYGGIQTVLAAERPGPRAAIDFAGAAIRWRNSPELQHRMKQAAARAAVPIMLVQAQNDYDLSPSYALAKELERGGKLHKLSIYPPYGSSVRDGHGGFCARATDVWGPEVLAFLEAHLKD